MKNFPIRAILPPEAGELEGFRIFTIQEILAGEDLKQTLHRHDFYFILLLCKGNGTHEIDFLAYPIAANTVSIMRPGQVHLFNLKADSEGYWLAFNKEYGLLSTTKDNTLLRKATSLNFYNLNEKEMNVLSAIFKTMLDEYRSRDEKFEHVIQTNLEVLLIQFLRYQHKDQIACSGTNKYQQEKLQEFLDQLETNISITKQVAAYANMLNLTYFQLNSITKSLLGKTVSALIEEQVLLEAKRYLLGSTDQVSQIAFQLGYMDVSYFIRFFRKKTGVTPDAFRNNSI